MPTISGSGFRLLVATSTRGILDGKAEQISRSDTCREDTPPADGQGSDVSAAGLGLPERRLPRPVVKALASMGEAKYLSAFAPGPA